MDATDPLPVVKVILNRIPFPLTKGVETSVSTMLSLYELPPLPVELMFLLTVSPSNKQPATFGHPVPE